MTLTIILGAGVAGLAAARWLQEDGHEVTVIEKGNVVGGRLATHQMAGAVLDHGAQFFTTRGDEIKTLVAEAMSEGVVAEWCRGFATEDGFPRYRGTRGMASVAQWLATGVDVQLGVSVDHIESNEGKVRFIGTAELGTGDLVVAEAEQAIVTAPVPQMLELFDRGNVQANAGLDQALRAVRYFATLALLVVVDGEENVDEPGGMQFDDGAFTFIAENKRKGISMRRALTFHANHDFSLRHFDDDTEEVRAALLEQAAPWLGKATIVESTLKKWRYAGPVAPLPERTYVIETNGARIALAGDAFAGPKVEGAFISGQAAAAALLAQQRL